MAVYRNSDLWEAPFATRENIRWASDRWPAAPFVRGVHAPSVPVRMLATVEVFEGWKCSDCPTELCEDNHKTLRELHVELLAPCTTFERDYPYLWWVWSLAPKRRALYEDAAGLPFVKLGRLWQLAYPLHAIRGLAGAQGAPDNDFTKLPPNGYFVVFDHESGAQAHLL